MPVMNGLQATRIIRSFEETGSWEAAEKAGIELNVSSLEGPQNGQSLTCSTKRMPIIAVMTSPVLKNEIFIAYRLRVKIYCSFKNADDSKCIVGERGGVLRKWYGLVCVEACDIPKIETMSRSIFNMMVSEML